MLDRAADVAIVVGVVVGLLLGILAVMWLFEEGFWRMGRAIKSVSRILVPLGLVAVVGGYVVMGSHPVTFVGIGVLAVVGFAWLMVP